MVDKSRTEIGLQASVLVGSWSTSPDARISRDGRYLLLGDEADVGGSAVGVVGSSTALFDAFVRLGRPMDREPSPREWRTWASGVVEFAATWGALGLCEHDLPASHRGQHRIDEVLIAEADGRWIDVLPDGRLADEMRKAFSVTACRPANQEALATWRFFATQAHTILQAAATLRRGEPDDAHVRQIVPLTRSYLPWLFEPPPPLQAGGPVQIQMAGSAPIEYERASLTRREAVRAQRAFVAAVIGEWLTLAEAALTVSWDEDGGLETHYAATASVFGAVAENLVLRVAGRMDRFWICSHCSTPYSDRIRAPRRGTKNNYCEACRTAGPQAAFRSKRAARERDERDARDGGSNR